MTSVVVLGDVMVDVVVRLSGPLAPGSDAPAAIELRDGGSAANVAAWLASAGAKPTLVGRVGDDADGRRVSAQLVDSGVDARLALDPVRSTGRCVVLVTPDGERTMAPDSGANERLADGDLPDDLLRPGAHLHVAGYALLRAGSGPAARSAIARAVRRRMTVSVDPASAALLSPSFLDDAAGAGLLLPNAEEAEVLTRERDPERAARLLAARFAEVVVTLGPEGALWTNGREILRVDAVPVELGVDSIGAGDAFTAGLLAARLTGAGPAEAMVMGTRLAASAVATPGGRP